MGLVEAVRSCLNKYAEFTGRAPRSEYWFFTLFYFLAALAIVLLGVGIGAAIRSDIGGGLVIFAMIAFMLGMLLPHLAVTIRRLHDVDMSGWWYLIVFVPFGSIVLFVFTVLPGTPGANRFGPNPFENLADVFS